MKGLFFGETQKSMKDWNLDGSSSLQLQIYQLWCDVYLVCFIANQPLCGGKLNHYQLSNWRNISHMNGWECVWYWKLPVGYDALMMPVCKGKERKALSLPRKQVFGMVY